MKSVLAAFLLLVSALAHAGDSDGGGGGSLPQDHVTIQDVFTQIHAAKSELRLFLIHGLLEFSRNESPSAFERKLYGGPRTILDLFEDTDVEIRADRPCFDRNGQAWDGSIYASRPGAICLSAYRLAPKLVEEVMRKEVMALALHELSHLMGASEEEAEAYQRKAAAIFKLGHKESASQFLLELAMHSMRGFEAAAKIAQQMDKMQSRELLDAMADISETYREFWPEFLQLRYAMLTPQEAAYNEQVQRVRFELANEYALCHSDWENRQDWCDSYAKRFGGRSEITVKEYWEHAWLPSRGPLYFPNEKIKRITSRMEFREFLRSVEDHLREQWIYGYVWSQGNPLPPLTGPWSRLEFSPWRKFQGNYEVTAAECRGEEAPSQFTAFSIQPIEGQMTLELKDATGRGAREGLFDGAADGISGAESIRVSGGENFALKRSEDDSSWSKNWRTRDWKMEETPNGLRMIRRLYERSQDAAHYEEKISECAFRLRRI